METFFANTAREDAKKLRKQGYSFSKIANKLNCSITTARSLCLYQMPSFTKSKPTYQVIKKFTMKSKLPIEPKWEQEIRTICKNGFVNEERFLAIFKVIQGFLSAQRQEIREKIEKMKITEWSEKELNKKFSFYAGQMDWNGAIDNLLRVLKEK